MSAAANTYTVCTLHWGLDIQHFIKFSQQPSEVDGETKAQRGKVTCPRPHH